MYFGLGAGMMPTATAVVADLMDVARNRLRRHVRAACRRSATRRSSACRSIPIGDLVTAYYLRFMARDRPGVLAGIAGILGRHRIRSPP